MARIAGVDLPPQKRLLGRPDVDLRHRPAARAVALRRRPDVDPTKKIKDLTEEEINRLRQAIESEGRVEGDLRKEIQMNIRRLIEIQCYRGTAPPPQSSGARPAHAHQRAHAQGPAQGRGRREEESRGPEVSGRVADADRESSRERSTTWQKNRAGRSATPGAGENVQAQERVQEEAREARGAARRGRTSRRRSTTRSSRSPIRMAARLLVFRRLDRLQGFAQGHALCRAAGRDDGRRRGARPVRHEIVEVRVKGPGSGRESAVRALASCGPAHRAHQGRDAGSAQRLPSAQAPPRLSRKRLVKTEISTKQVRWRICTSGRLRRNAFGKIIVKQFAGSAAGKGRSCF